MKSIGYRKSLLMLPLFMLLPLSVFADINNEYLTGNITSLIRLQENVNVTPGEKVIINLGIKDGLMKGDILQISEDAVNPLLNPIGKCALVKVDPDSGVCEIISAKKEISQANIVFTHKLKYADRKLYPAIVDLLCKIIEPYKPYEKLNLFIHDIFDDKGNITEYSEKIKNEIHHIFSQKNRIVLKTPNSKDFLFYPNGYKDNRNTLDDFMREIDVDVFITGFYHVDKETVKLSIYKFDQQYGEKIIDFNMSDMISWRFSEHDFKDDMTIKALCEKIRQDKYGLKLKQPDNTASWLNEILELPSFYEIYLSEKKPLETADDIQQFVHETDKYRQKSFIELTKKEKENIIRLNRRILEVAYPHNCPTNNDINDLKREIIDLSGIVSPFKPVKKIEYITCHIKVKETTLSGYQYNKEDILKYEAGGNLFLRNSLKTREFNVIAPTQVVVFLDKHKLVFDEKNEAIKTLSKGFHTITVYFKRGYFLNTKNLIAHESEEILSRNVGLFIKKEGNLKIEITLTPEFHKETIKVKAYREQEAMGLTVEDTEVIKPDKIVKNFVD